ncbi:hypothetical protein TWF569_009329 [Orbilia oligospora]|uniref:DUF7514 domain-containing protein n=1 Tax=Orbilia oligospora TaxID=2813651 RepID=A0A7C8K2B1_ORBOL|nr:hypothetical protein TWF103_009820 [Orbilia oligospora]KAF3133203.1 hypothetical protein TWF703_007045 [Orbilia oligospora]KAF3136055.1 hypothetical protein TWF594_008028 [Orbilia oligospora]KAF3137049.1 hypothetical protein TWF569_009329 [Orbilia oligospora]
MPPKVDDYPTDPGDHGIMARYQSFNLSAGADAALEFLEALYVLHDSFEKAYKGYITLMKLLGCMFEENGVVFRDEDDLTDKEGDYISHIVKNIDWVLPQIYDAMECQYVIVQPVTDNPFKTYRKPTVPMLTRNGFIKFVLVNYLERAARGDYRPHNILFAITEKYRLLVPGTSRPVMPIDDRKQVEKNFRDLASELQIPLDRLARQIRSFKEIPPTSSASASASAAVPSGAAQKSQQPISSQPETKRKPSHGAGSTGGIGSSSKIYAPSMGSENISRGGGSMPAYEQPPVSEYSRYRSDYSSKSYRRSPSPESPRREREGYMKPPASSPPRRERDRERERESIREREKIERERERLRERERERERDRDRDRDIYNLKPSPTYFSPPPQQQHSSSRKSAMDVQREKERIREERERMELLVAEQELKDMEAHYERVAKEREFKSEMEYIQAQKRGLEAAAISIEESTDRMRHVGLDDYYEWKYRY